MSKSSPFKHEKADDSAGFLLWKITALWRNRLEEVLRNFGITQTQYAILASLKWFEVKKEPTTQSHLSEHTKIEKMTISKAIRQLEKKDLVIRKPSTLDNRATNVCLSSQGKNLINRAIIAIENADEEFFSCLNDKQLELYKSLTSTVIMNNGL
ncbi:MAG TPA: MarR family transcriptional regulator [Aeromonadales bacterium]|nr:MarR family transcriptional regulator [Aeromonadales bacterium]